MSKATFTAETADSYIEKIATFNAHLERYDQGINRLAFTPAETEALEWVKQKLEDLDYYCEFDPFLNLHAYEKNRGKDRMVVGTHIDSVLNGGKYDGIVGLVTFLMALEQARANKKQFKYAVDLVIFRAEESTVFKEALLGSKVATGLYDLEQLMEKIYKRVEDIDPAYEQLYENQPALQEKEFHWTPVDLISAYTKRNIKLSDIKKGCWFFKDKDGNPFKDYKRYYEIHIEQGKVLELEQIDFGIVTSIRAPLRYIVSLSGKRDHSGATPMGKAFRRDVLCAAGECILAIEKICEDEAEKGTDIVGTVGSIKVPGMGINIIAGECSFTIDLRSNNGEDRSRVFQEIQRQLETICKNRNIKINLDNTENSQPVSLLTSESEGYFQTIENQMKQLGFSSKRMPSGAGHDAMRMAQVGIPVCLLFIPCKDGISHSPSEFSSGTHIANAAQLLYHVLLKGI